MPPTACVRIVCGSWQPSKPRHCAARKSNPSADLHRMARRLPRHAVERIEQPLAPGMDRIVLVQDPERADDAGPLKRAEHDVVRVVRRIAAEIFLRVEG